MKKLTCAICLDPCDNPTKLDQCFHTYCFLCIMHWGSLIQTCPMCKSPFSSLIHSYNEDTKTYEREYLDQKSKTVHSFSQVSTISKRKRIYVQKLKPVIDFNIADVPFPERDEEDRRLRYARETWRHKLATWVVRELRVLLTYNGHVPEAELGDEVEIVTHIIGHLLEKYGDLVACREAKTELSDFLFGNTEQFLFELMLFLRSSWTMDQYDERVLYTVDGKIPEVDIQNEQLLLGTPQDTPVTDTMKHVVNLTLPEDSVFFDEFGTSGGYIPKKEFTTNNINPKEKIHVGKRKLEINSKKTNKKHKK